ncbi:MAG: YdcF family protein [Methylococcaceae bacterium]|jgi:uncharacterized SAM-binding protein YcdF (DUF218 family)
MKCIYAAISFLLFLVVIAFINLGYWLSAPANEPIQADLIVALGGGTGERDQMAAELYKAGHAKKILLTGMGVSSNAGQSYYQSPRSLFLLKQGIPSEALIFDGLSTNTHQEAFNTAALLVAYNWQSALVVSDPPHIRRLDYCLQPVFKKAGLSYQLIQSTAPTWHADRWWQDKKWLQFCVSEVVKLVYYALAYRN